METSIMTVDEVRADTELKATAVEIDSLNQLAASLVITTPEQEAAAIDLTKRVKEIGKAVDGRYKAMTEGANAFLKTVRDIFRPKQDSLADIERVIKAKIVGYRNEVDRLARIEADKAEKARREAEAKQQAAHAKKVEKAAAKGVEPPPPPIAMPPIAAQTQAKSVKTESGAGGTFRTVKKYEITDANAIPREYLMVNEKLVAAAVRNGIGSIPGVRIYDDRVLSIT